MRVLPGVAVVALLSIAGCFGGGAGGGEPGPVEPTEPAPPEADNGVLHVSFSADGPATLEVPFPHLDACMAPQDWLAGNVTSSAGAGFALANATGGRQGQVLAVSGEGQVSWSSQVTLKPACATLRHDPWSVDPDPAERTVDVRVTAGNVTAPTVLVRWVRNDCGNATLHEGEAGSGWSTLTGRSIPVASC